MIGPLHGLKVVDIASLYAAPLAASLLADFGADVVKVEPLEGDGFRGTKMWSIVARGKKSLTLDLRSAHGCDTLKELVAGADVLVENFPAAVLKKRGLDWDSLKIVNPRLVMLSVSCFGQTGPYAERPGSGTIAEGFAGLTHLTGERDGPPLLPSVALGDAIGAMNAVIGVLTALYWRDRGGSGQQVDASLHEPILHAIGQAFQFWEAGTEHPTRNGSQMPVGSGLRNVYATADGAHVVISASTTRHFDALVDLSGADRDDPDVGVSQWITTIGLDQVMNLLTARRIPVAQVSSLDQLLNDPHIAARQSLVRYDDPVLGMIVVPSPSPRLTSSPGSIRHLGAPLGADTDEVLRSWAGLSLARIRTLRATRVIG